ncbi:MAG: protein kinase, partial [Phycisphaerales bacterium JB041]
MPDETRIRQILEELLESGASPEEACKGDPRLLEAVRVRLARLREVDEQLDRLFPTPVASRPNRRSTPDAPRLACGLPPIPGYEIESLIGSGGMGAVYKARHLRLNRPVAIKTLLLGPYATQRDLDCLVREAEAVAALGHPNIVRVYDVGEVDGLPYFTMEYIDGGNLAQKLAGVPCPARRAAELLATLADAVQAAHSAGVVHRDLKPANVLLDASGTPKVADFSLARRLDTVPVPNMAGARMGTPSYMAPEQAAGELSAFSPAVDIYALGVLLYEFLTGRPPFHADSPAETQRQVIAEPPAPPTRLNARVPRDLETICMKCLEKDPARRYPTAAAVAEDARHFLRGEPIAARPVGAVERWARWTKRNPTGAGLLLAALVVLALLVGTGIREWTLQERRRAEFANWQERLDFVLVLQSEGRFTEARAILGRVPDAGSEALRGEIDQAVAALDLVERLEAIRLGRGRFVRGGGIDYEQSSRAYEFAFREAGFGGVGDDPAGVAARLAASPARTALVAAFDDWAACAAAEPRGWVLNVARRADPDPWRDRVRDQARWASVDHLEELAASVDTAAQPVTIMVAMGTRWRRLGGDPSGFLRRVYQAHPDDFWLNFELAHLSGERDLAEAIAYSRAALALRPDASAAHYNLAIYLARAGRPADATHHLRRTLESDPTHAWAQSLLASMLTESHSLAEAAREWDNAVRLEPENPAWRTQWRSTLTSLGRGREVID